MKPASSGFAEISNTKLYYQVNGEGFLIVLMHSGYIDSRMWDNQFDLLSQYFKVLRYDFRGFGNSATPTQSFSHVTDLYELMSYLHIKKAHLIGCSMGGSIAIDFALTYPEMVRSLVLSGASVNGFTYEPDEKSAKRSKLAHSIVFRDENFEQSLDKLLDDEMWKQTNPKAVDHLRTMFSESSLKWLGDNYVSQTQPFAIDRLNEIQCNVLSIIGENDSIPIKQIGGFLQSNIKNIETRVIKGTGHLPNLDKPNEFNDLVLSFLLKN